jgi:ribonuclease P protein component
VLSRRNRLSSSTAFKEAVRRGRRSGGRLLVVHLQRSAVLADTPAAASPPQIGFVVSKAVGPAVTRNLVKRRLRHHLRERVSALPEGSVVVVRALPAAAGAPYLELCADLDRCLERSLRVAS